MLGGILRGCGKQLQVAVINVCSYYVLGLPISFTLVYATDMGALGFWIGCTVGSFCQVQYMFSISAWIAVSSCQVRDIVLMK